MYVYSKLNLYLLERTTCNVEARPALETLDLTLCTFTSSFLYNVKKEGQANFMLDLMLSGRCL